MSSRSSVERQFALYSVVNEAVMATQESGRQVERDLDALRCPDGCGARVRVLTWTHSILPFVGNTARWEVTFACGPRYVTDDSGQPIEVIRCPKRERADRLASERRHEDEMARITSERRAFYQM